MKKHSEALNKVQSDKLAQTVTDLKKEVQELVRGIRAGDVQNYKSLRAKRKEIARLMGRINKEVKESK